MDTYCEPSTPTLELSEVGGRDNTTAAKIAEMRTLLKKRKRELCHRAWNNLIAIGINTAIRLRIISLTPDGQFWTETPKAGQKGNMELMLRFSVADIPAIIHLSPSGHDELAIRVALWPSDIAENVIDLFGMFNHAGSISAVGWLQHEDGKWLQLNKVRTRKRLFYCADYLLESLANLDIEPLGFEQSHRY